MAFDEKLADRVREIIATMDGFTEKKMFGGLAFMHFDKMCVGVLGDKLIARVGPHEYSKVIKEPYVKPFDFTGKPLKGFVYVGSQAIKGRGLRRWVERCVSIVGKLPVATKGRRRTISQAGSREEARALPLSRLVNFGPVTRKEFKEMGITTFGQLEDMGWQQVCRKWVEHYPERLNANAFLGVIATIEGIVWTKASSSDRAQARALVEAMREEYGITSARVAKRRRP